MVASIAEFYVDPDFRRASVGTEAVGILMAGHRDRGTYLVEADILRANESAKAFRYGLSFELQFHQTGRKPSFAKLRGLAHITACAARIRRGG